MEVSTTALVAILRDFGGLGPWAVGVVVGVLVAKGLSRLLAPFWALLAVYVADRLLVARNADERARQLLLTAATRRALGLAVDLPLLKEDELNGQGRDSRTSDPADPDSWHAHSHEATQRIAEQ